MPIASPWTIWIQQLLALVLSVPLGVGLLLQLAGTEARDAPPPRGTDPTALARVGLTDADLPAGWRVHHTAPRPPWPSEAAARAVWLVTFGTDDGVRGGVERVVLFPSPREAKHWLAEAQHRAAARHAGASPCRALPGVLLATRKARPNGTWVEQLTLRQDALVLRLVVSHPAASPAGASCTAEAQAIVAHARQRARAALAQAQTAGLTPPGPTAAAPSPSRGARDRPLGAAALSRWRQHRGADHTVSASASRCAGRSCGTPLTQTPERLHGSSGGVRFSAHHARSHAG